MSPPATTSQTVGPFFKIGLSPLYRTELASAEIPGERITIQGRVLDGQGHAIPDAVLEIWQADAEGNYSQSLDFDKELGGSSFFGFGRIPTDAQGSFRFSTVKPGSVPGTDGNKQAPHILVSLFMRGLLIRLVTRIYFLNDPANEKDFALQLVEPARRSTLMAIPINGNPSLLEWNVILQGEQETVFFDF
ncbi:MAG TPA: protocatechuate 3,4-dioxygenase subunit alpha [Candidatus Acidoferrum sp.]|jgi:protocatechuate 3,4-dioxygenase alpha subunit